MHVSTIPGGNGNRPADRERNMSIGLTHNVAPAQRPALGPSVAFFAALAGAGFLALATARALHWDYAEPFAVSALFVFAAAAAIAGWRRRRATASPSVTYWDVAGALTLLGIAAAALIEPEQMMRVLATRPA